MKISPIGLIDLLFSKKLQSVFVIKKIETTQRD